MFVQRELVRTNLHGCDCKFPRVPLDTCGLPAEHRLVSQSFKPRTRACGLAKIACHFWEMQPLLLAGDRSAPLAR